MPKTKTLPSLSKRTPLKSVLRTPGLADSIIYSIGKPFGIHMGPGAREHYRTLYEKKKEENSGRKTHKRKSRNKRKAKTRRKKSRKSRRKRKTKRRRRKR